MNIEYQDYTDDYIDNFIDKMLLPLASHPPAWRR